MNHTSTLPRSSMAPRNYGHSHGTMVKKQTATVPASGEELRPLTGNGNGDQHHHVHQHHQHNMSTDTLRRVRFEKTGTPDSSNTPTSPMSTMQKEEPMNDVTSSGVTPEDVVVNPPTGNGSVKNNGNANSTFKSPPHQPHCQNEQEADTRM